MNHHFSSRKVYHFTSGTPSARPAPEKTVTGLGDTVEKVIKYLGIQKIMGKTPCNCAKRKSWLNKLFPYS